MKQKAKGEQQILKRANKLHAKLLREQEQNLLAKQRAEAVAQRKQDAAERQALKQQEKEKHATSKADQIVMPAPGGSIPEEVFTKARLLSPNLVAASLAGMVFAIEIYAGCARLSGAMAEKGLNLFVPIDKKYGSWGDVTNPSVAAIVLLAFDMGLIWYCHLATECKMWSGARKVNTQCDPAVLWFTIEVLKRIKGCQARGMKVLFSIENPYPSALFHVSEMKELLAALGATCVQYECCAWGATWQKSSQLRTNVEQLAALGKRCRDLPQHSHEVLEGTVTLMIDGSPQNIWKTSLAAKYVPALCRAWAGILKEVAPQNALAAPGATTMSPVWQHWLVRACDLEFTEKLKELALPTCPAVFTTGLRPSAMSCRV